MAIDANGHFQYSNPAVGKQVVIEQTRVPMWTRLHDDGHCDGEPVKVPHGHAGEIVDGTLKRPLVRAWYLGKWRYGWLMTGDFTVVA